MKISKTLDHSIQQSATLFLLIYTWKKQVGSQKSAHLHHVYDVLENAEALAFLLKDEILVKGYDLII